MKLCCPRPMLQRVNDTLRQCRSCGKVTNIPKPKTPKPKAKAAEVEVTAKPKRVKMLEAKEPAPEGYKRSAYLAEKYDVKRATIRYWASRGIVARFGTIYFYEKDVALWADSLNQHKLAGAAGRIVNHSPRSQVRHGSLDYYS